MTLVGPNLLDTKPNPVDEVLPEADTASDTDTNTDADAGIQRDVDIFPAAVPVGTDTGVERSNSGADTMVDRTSQAEP